MVAVAICCCSLYQYTRGFGKHCLCSTYTIRVETESKTSILQDDQDKVKADEQDKGKADEIIGRLLEADCVEMLCCLLNKETAAQPAITCLSSLLQFPEVQKRVGYSTEQHHS